MQLDISMKDEYEKASKLLESTEQLWDTLQTEDFEALPTNDPAASHSKPPQAETLEQQIMRDMLGDSGSQGTPASPPSASNSRSSATMSLYDQMDAMLGSISAGSFSAPTGSKAQPPSATPPAGPLPSLRAPTRPNQPQRQQQQQESPQEPATPDPPPKLSSRPALGAASARDDDDEDDLSAADLERRAVELEEALFPGAAGQDDLLQADPVMVARQRLQDFKSGKADVGSGSSMGDSNLEDRFPDLDLEGASMEALLAAKDQPRCAPIRCRLSLTPSGPACRRRINQVGCAGSGQLCVDRELGVSL